MVPVVDRRRDVLASLSLILAARGLDCAQTELGKKQLFKTAFIVHKYLIITKIQFVGMFRLFSLIFRYRMGGERSPTTRKRLAGMI